MLGVAVSVFEKIADIVAFVSVDLLKLELFGPRVFDPNTVEAEAAFPNRVFIGEDVDSVFPKIEVVADLIADESVVVVVTPNLKEDVSLAFLSAVGLLESILDPSVAISESSVVLNEDLIFESVVGGPNLNIPVCVVVVEFESFSDNFGISDDGFTVNDVEVVLLLASEIGFI